MSIAAVHLSSNVARGHDSIRVMVVDDSPLGIEAGNRAGMTTIGFSALMPAGRLAAATGGVVHGMAELRSRLP